MGRAVVVVLAPPGSVPAAVRDVLRDWVALGLVQPLLWVDAVDVDPGAALSSVVGTHLLPDDAPRVRLQDHLANERALQVLRLVALGSVGAETTLVPASLAGHLNTQLSAAAPGRLVALQCVLTRQGAGGWEPDLAVPGWRTLVVAPEDSWSPGRTTTEFAVDSNDAEFVSHAAAGLASVAGLWTGVGQGPFDGGSPDSGEPQVVRAFLRRLDTAALTSRLRRALTDVSGGLPLPQSSSGRIEAMQDPQAGVAQVASALVAQHPALFEVAWLQPEQVRKKRITAWEAVTLFFAFLWSAVRGAPAALVERVQDRGAVLVARRVQNALFGGDSRYEVVMRGLNASGQTAGVRDLGAAADDVRDRLATVVPTESTTSDLSGFWSDVAAGALSLADGGEHGSTVGPLTVGGNPRVVRDTAHVAPAPTDAFELPPAVGARLGSPSVSPYDQRVQQQAAETLSQVAPSDPANEDLARWRQRTAASYTGLLGARLSADVEHRRQALGSLLDQLRADGGGVDESEVARPLRAARRILLRTVVGLVVIAALTYLVQRLELLTTLVLTVAAVVLVLGWLVSQVLALLAEQRKVFALLNAQERRDEALEVAGRNVPIAATALNVSTTLYQQYLAWAPVLGRFLREPFGPVPEPAPATRLHGTLPRAVGFGVADTDDERLAAVAHDLGSVVFDRGWLQPLWEAFLAEAPRLLGPSGLALRDEPRLLYQDAARDEGSLLRRWSAAVVEQGVPAGAGDALWRRARAALVGRGTALLSEDLLTHVEVQAQQAHGITAPVTGRQFFTELTDALADADRHYLSPRSFTDLALTQDRHRVAATVALGRSEVASLGTSGSASSIRWVEPEEQADGGLDQFLVVLQTTSAVPGSLLTLAERPQPAPPAGSGRAGTPGPFGGAGAPPPSGFVRPDEQAPPTDETPLV
ncbi:MAG: hypothetical protein JWO60_1406 [Frankiales bacterium]|nr:hypothetical protein [Frankiales bacterium]